MPEKFNKCVSGGGKVRTKSLSGNRFIHLCIPKGGGSSVAGEVKTKEKKGKNDTNTPDGRVYRKG